MEWKKRKGEEVWHALAFDQAHFVKELIKLKPSLGQKLSKAAWSPLHVALLNRKWKTARQLVRLNSKLIRVNGREGFTPLHILATMYDDEAIELLAQFLCDCPEAIGDLTVQDNTVLHIAVRYQNVKAFKVLFEWVWRTDNRDVLTWGDDENNTVLHVAAETRQLEIVKLLMSRAGKMKDLRNSEGLTALDLAKKLGCDTENEVASFLVQAKAPEGSKFKGEIIHLSNYLNGQENIFEHIARFIMLREKRLTSEMCNRVLVVAVLIATATFQAALQPPASGRFWEEESSTSGTTSNINNGQLRQIVITRIITDASVLFFYLLNTVAFTCSIIAIILVLHWQSITYLLHVSLMFMVFSYGLALNLLGHPMRLAAPLLLLGAFVTSGICYLSKMLFRVLDYYATSEMTGWAKMLYLWDTVIERSARVNHFTKRFKLLYRLVGKDRKITPLD
ncbi:hypothetical protein NMG60_11027414 [Bertholletia excelsa]